MPEIIRNQYKLFEEIYSRHNGTKVSQSERTIGEGYDKQEYTYGEIVFPSFLPLLELAFAGYGERIFWDIGCGSAKPVAIAAMSGHFTQAKGVEFLPDLAQLGKDACTELRKLADEQQVNLCPIEIMKGDLLKCGWQKEADVVYLSSVCFPKHLTDEIVR